MTWLVTNPLPSTSVFGFLYLVFPLIRYTDECKVPYPSDSTPAVAKVLFVCSWLHHLKDEKKKKIKFLKLLDRDTFVLAQMKTKH